MTYSKAISETAAGREKNIAIRGPAGNRPAAQAGGGSRLGESDLILRRFAAARAGLLTA